MSSMLEQAIIDANALREVAKKNAEQSVLDKYSSEIKKAVDTLLEQKEDKGSPLMPDMEGLMTSPELENAVSSAANKSNTSASKKEPFTNIKDSFKTKNEEMINISFSALEEALDLDEDMLVNQDEEEEETEEEGFDLSLDTAYGNDSDVGIGGIDEYDLEEEEMYNMPDEPTTTQIPETGMNIDADSLSLEEEEEYELEEELFGEEGNLDDTLEEVLTLDMSLSNQGHLGHNPVHHREQYKIAAALEAQEAELEIKSKKKEKKLQEEFIKLRDVVSQLTEAYTDLRTQFLETVELSKKVSEQNENLVIENKKLASNLKIMVNSNGKLLYTNKVLGNQSLNERQKQSLVEAISKADSVEKAKVIYETLQSGTQSAVRRAPESLSEAINKAPSPYYTQHSTQQIKTSPIVERMQVLAGIKKQVL